MCRNPTLHPSVQSYPPISHQSQLIVWYKLIQSHEHNLLKILPKITAFSFQHYLALSKAKGGISREGVGTDCQLNEKQNNQHCPANTWIKFFFFKVWAITHETPGKGPKRTCRAIPKCISSSKEMPSCVISICPLTAPLRRGLSSNMHRQWWSERHF